jgi:hypothetical protein
MRSVRGFILLAFLSAAPLLHADVTVRYKTDFKLGSFVPPAVQQQFSTQKLPFPPVMVMQIKGDKGYTNAGLTASLLDFNKQQITMMDSTHKLFATVYMKDFPGELGAGMPAMPAIPPMAQKILDSVTSNFSARKTGRSDTILGVQVEESELTLAIELPVPADLPLPPGMFKPGEIVTVMKVVIQIWTATPSEVSRVPALNEFGAHMSAMRLVNSAGWMQGMFGRLPGFAQGFAPMLDYFSKSTTPMLRSRSEIYLPVLAQIAQTMQTQAQKLPPGLDANSPLAETNTEAIEISAAALDDSIFQVPADYQPTSLSDLFKTLTPVPTTPKPPATSVPTAP